MLQKYVSQKRKKNKKGVLSDDNYSWCANIILKTHLDIHILNTKDTLMHYHWGHGAL